MVDYVTKDELNSALAATRDDLKSEMNKATENMRVLIDALTASISREMSEVKNGIQRIEVRMGKHAAILNGGARQITGILRWSKEVDEMLQERDEAIADLSRRVDKLEGKA